MNIGDYATRWLIRRDLAAVFEIEQQSFPQPWDEDDFGFMLRDHKIIGMVADTTTGASVQWTTTSRAAMTWTGC